MGAISYILVSPLAIIGMLMVIFPGPLKEWVENLPRYAMGRKFSVGFVRAYGIGFIFAAAASGWMMDRPLSSGQRQPLPSIAHDPHEIDLLVDGTTVPAPEPLSSTQPVTLPTSRPQP